MIKINRGCHTELVSGSRERVIKTKMQIRYSKCEKYKLFVGVVFNKVFDQ